MVNKKQLVLIFGISGLTLLSLLIAQILWGISSFRQNKEEVKGKVNSALASVAKKANDGLGCFELFSKVYIKPGQGFYMYKPSLNGKGDTLPMLFAGNGKYYKDKVNILKKFNRLDFNYPVSAEVVIRFEYLNDSTDMLKIPDSLFNMLTAFNYRELLSGNKPVEKIYNLHLLDSLLKTELIIRKIDIPYSFAIVESTSGKIVCKSDSSPDKVFSRNEFTGVLNNGIYFSKPYHIALVFHHSVTSLSHTTWLMLLISGVIILLLALIIWYFIRTILRQKKIDDMKNDFINNITHEFNTPISNIALAVESLTGKRLTDEDPKIKRLLEIIRTQNIRLNENVEQILQVAVYEKGQPDIKMEVLNTADLIKTVCAFFEFLLEQKEGGITTEFPSEPLRIKANETYMIHALQNILDNAIKYNTGKPIIRITLSGENGWVKIAISDNGIGMKPDEIQLIFDKFYRVPTGNIHNIKGFGLGLNFAQSIVKLHGGNISVKSAPHKGSVFYVIIPQQV